MRTHLAQYDRIFSARGQATHFRAWIKDAGGTFQNICALYGVNFVTAVEFHESLDQPAAMVTITGPREVNKLSLSPDMAASRINQLGGGPAFIDYNRDVKIEAQIQPVGLGPDSSAWQQIFYGAVEDWDFGPDSSKIICRDLVMRLQSQNFIKTERAYGIWQKSRRLLANTVVIPTTDNPGAPSAYWQAQSTFTTGATEPTWPASPIPGTTIVADNGGTWLCLAGPTGTLMETQIQQLLDDNAGVGAWSLYTPVGSLFVLRDYNQAKEPLWSPLRRIADLKGWDLRWMWDDGTSQFRLKLYDPGRSLSSPVYTLPASKYLPIPKWARDNTARRNDIEISYPDRGTLDANGNPTRTSVFATDPTSMAAYGDLYMGIAEGASSMIDTAAEANAMAAAVLSDLNQAPLVATVQMDFTWWLQLNDQVTVKADGLHSDTDQVLAIFSQTHTLRQGGAAITELGLRSKPSSGFKRWWQKGALPGLNGGPIKAANLRAPVGVTTIPTINGATISFQPPSQKEMKGYDHTQLFVSVTPGFTPGAANRVHTSRSGRFDLGPGTVGATGALTPGTAYRARLAHCDVRGNLSPYSAEFTFTPGFADLAHLNPNITQNCQIGIASTSTQTSAVNNFYIPFNAAQYDRSGVFDAANHRILTKYDGYFQIRGQIYIFGGLNIGDGVQLLVLDGVGSNILPDGQIWPVSNPAGTASPICVASIDGYVSIPANTVVRLLCSIYLADGRAFPTISYQSNNNVAAPPYIFNTYLSLSQQLS